MELPRRLARFNRVVTNPIQGTWAWLLPPWAVICHRGRRSGRPYRTPVNAYVRGGHLYVVVLYGERSDWVRNVLAGGGAVLRAGRLYTLHDIRLLGAGELDAQAPRAVRLLGRLSGRVLVGRLKGPRPGFGRGPQR